MPIYDFRCEECGASFERMVEVGVASTECPECGSPRTTRVFVAPRPPMKFVKGRATQRRQEARNAQLQKNARDRFKQAMKPVHEAKRRAARSRRPEQG